jgi:hemoglobin/transferrin/lactoferrin receptor protein
VVETLPEIVVTAPRITQGPFVAGPETIGSPLRATESTFAVPYATNVETSEDLRERRNVRNTPDALLRLPSTMVQKTGPGQSSPFLRGFTGYHDLFLIDGVRLNNSTFRAGPNPYWNTVDAYTIGRLEISRGPHSVLWGSDAVGGTVYVVPHRRECFPCGFHVNGGLFSRYATAEDAWFERAEIEGNRNQLGFLGGVTYRDFGDLESGAGRLPETAYTELDVDFRADYQLSCGSLLSLAYQHVGQDDVPRTHATIHAVPFAGSTVGTDLQRDLDQTRDLLYAKYAWEDAGGLFPEGHVLLSYHRQQEEQERLRTGGRLDFAGFDVETLGASVQLGRPTCFGHLTFGVDAYHDEVDSHQDNFVNGVPQAPTIQGPVGDDASYDLVGVYVQDRITRGCWEFVPGLHFTYAHAKADRVDNPAVAGSNPATAGNVLSMDEDWTALVGSLRARYQVSRSWNLYGGVSQAFRAPSLSDLTAFETTSVTETPSLGLQPDKYVGFELGVKTEQRRLTASAAAWYMVLDDTIVRSPTGVLIGGVPEVRKDNVGDGWLWGVEAEAAWRFSCDWVAFGNASYMDGEVDQFDLAQNPVRDDFDRLMPFTTLLGLRFEPQGGRFWAQAEWVHAEKADRLSFQNETDTQRIPPGGTPGYDVFHVRAGYRLRCDTDVLLVVENLTDQDYRIHGSGVNEPGLNFVLGLDLRF